MSAAPTDTPHADPATDRRFRIAAAVAAVAAAFCLVVAAALLGAHLNYRLANPLDTGRWTTLKAQLAAAPADDGLKRQLRQLDLELRQAYFRHQRYLGTGALLLAAGVVVFVSAAKTAMSRRRPAPLPPGPAGGESDERREGSAARLAAAGTAALLAAIAVAMLPHARSSLALLRPPAADARPANGAAASGEPWPSDQELDAHWPAFRGPRGDGVATAPWPGGGPGLAVLWKAPLGLPGQGSPVCWGPLVLLSGADEQRREVRGFDASTGEARWQAEVPAIAGVPATPPAVLEDTGFAAPTMCTDGRRACALFANGDIAAFDMAGRPLWARNLGQPENPYGHASSPVMWQDLVLVQLDQGHADDGRSMLLALDGATGRTVWQVRRPVSASWASPVVDRIGGFLLTSADPYLIAYDVGTGAERWRAECVSGDVASTPLCAGGLVLAVSPSDEIVAIRPDGQGEVTRTHVAWTSRENAPDITSPVSDGQRLYVLGGEGRLTCLDLRDGSPIWTQELDLQFHASPALVGDRLLLVSTDGVVLGVSAGPEYRLLTRLELGDRVSASPAIVADRIFVRGASHLYSLGAADSAGPSPD